MKEERIPLTIEGSAVYVPTDLYDRIIAASEGFEDQSQASVVKMLSSSLELQPWIVKAALRRQSLIETAHCVHSQGDSAKV